MLDYLVSTFIFFIYINIITILFVFYYIFVILDIYLHWALLLNCQLSELILWSVAFVSKPIYKIFTIYLYINICPSGTSEYTEICMPVSDAHYDTY